MDAAPAIVQALGLQAVPTVIALLNGQLAPLFQGVLPKDQVQAAIDQLAQGGGSERDGGTRRARLVLNHRAAAEPEPEADPRYAAADAALRAR